MTLYIRLHDFEALYQACFARCTVRKSWTLPELLGQACSAVASICAFAQKAGERDYSGSIFTVW